MEKVLAAPRFLSNDFTADFFRQETAFFLYWKYFQNYFSKKTSIFENFML